MAKTACPALSPGQQLALDTILQKPVKGIGIWLINPMEWRMIDRLAGVPEGSYVKTPVPVYRQMLVNSGCCLVDQWIPTNPLSMGAHGYEGASHGATTGADSVVCDGIPIREPEDVVKHFETVVFPRLEKAIGEVDEDARVRDLIKWEAQVQEEIGPEFLKGPYGLVGFPGFAYGSYGYANYFMAYKLYPEVMEKHFRLQGEYWHRLNRAAARAWREGNLPPYTRLDHDMADTRGTLVDIRSLDRIWFPHFAHALEPMLKTDVRMIWHCDGDLMAMVPRLLEVGLRGFQGFEYEHGMDYRKICSLKTKDGDDLLIIGGVSVTSTLPYGTPEDVRAQMRFLVEYGPRRGLFLGGSSSITPGVPWENLQALTEGFRYYREHGREG